MRILKPGFTPLLSLLLTTSFAHAGTMNGIEVCHDFGCKHTTMVDLPEDEWKSIAGWFSPAAENAAEERLQIKKAIGWMEVVIGRHSPTFRDIGLDLENNLDAEFPGQLDCIDESINTTNYLKLFEQEGLLRFYTVSERAYRKAIFDQHWAALITDRESGESWVVDSWFQDNGYLPYIQRVESWEDISFLSAIVDNSPDQPGNNKSKTSLWDRFLRRQ